MGRKGVDGFYHFDCIICGKPSMSNSPRSIICEECKSSEAYTSYKKRTYKRKRVYAQIPESIECITCGRSFKPTNIQQKNCPECRTPHKIREGSRLALLRGYYTKYCREHGVLPVSVKTFRSFQDKIQALPEGSGGKDIYDLIRSLMTNTFKKKPVETIEEIDRKAAKEGLSYGMYVARHYYK